MESIVRKVNDQDTEINTIKETVLPSHLVQLAGFKLPVTATPTGTAAITTTPQPGNVDLKNSPRPLVESPQSITSEAGKKRKRENGPGQITLPKNPFDANKFTETNPPQMTKKQSVVKKEVPVKIEEETSNSPIVQPEPSIQINQAPQQTPSPQTQQPFQQTQPQPQPQSQLQQNQPSPQQPISQIQQQPVQQQGARPVGAPPVPQPLAGRMQNPLQLQQYLLQQRNNLLALGPNLSPVQQSQLQTIQTALVKLSEQIRRSTAARAAAGNPMSQMNSNAAVATTTTSSPFNSNAPTATTDNLMQHQNQINMASINPSQIPANLTPQQRMLLATQLAQRNVAAGKPSNINELQAQLLQQQQQQQGGNDAVSTQPLWTGQIVWHIKTPEGQLQEFNCLCGAFAIPTKGSITNIEE